MGKYLPRTASDDELVGRTTMIKRVRNQLMFANTLPDRWLRVAVAVAEQGPSDACARYWRGRGALCVSGSAPGSKKTFTLIDRRGVEARGGA